MKLNMKKTKIKLKTVKLIMKYHLAKTIRTLITSFCK